MIELTALARFVENLIRFGTIADIQMKPPRVQVKTGSLTTAWLPWLTPRAGADREWNPPTVGEQIILLSPSGQLSNGIVLTGLFSNHIPANGDRAGLHRCTYRDGAVIEYDSVAHHLNATLPNQGTTKLVSLGGIHITGPITHEGDYTQTGNHIVTGKITHKGNYTQQGNYTQTGNQTTTGKITASVDVLAAAISLVLHAHGGVMPGGSLTGPPL
ncbi:phage baseplate assembly protein V [Pseudomonas prosekii]|uniref:Phage baseplate assembly protein V n=1 Tax=Pseudomonas prosekii TaxID=1148509 RepID=A0A2U2DBJ1_9PSED|nr:phage baseplate assembly protein V [Pseudomonas prosekii]PWE46677.1 phage baseplate assembly protein V [Pseudomonas prosekii]